MKKHITKELAIEIHHCKFQKISRKIWESLRKYAKKQSDQEISDNQNSELLINRVPLYIEKKKVIRKSVCLV